MPRTPMPRTQTSQAVGSADLPPVPGSRGPLRGAQVSVDPGRVRSALVAVVLVSLGAASALLLLAGLHANQRVSRLRSQGVPVSLTVTGCLGQLGGSGSNAVGYRCRVSYRLDGQRLDAALPGTARYATGSVLAGLAVPAEPGLVTTPALLSGQRATASVFILPALMAAVVATASGWLGLRPARRRRRSGGAASATPLPGVGAA